MLVLQRFLGFQKINSDSSIVFKSRLLAVVQAPVPTRYVGGAWGRVCSLLPSAWLLGSGFSASTPGGLRSPVPVPGPSAREMPGRNCLCLR